MDVKYVSTKPLEEFAINQKHKADDLISRQSAIDAMGKDPGFKVKPFGKSYDEGRSDQWFRDTYVLTTVPSAQKTGKWLEKNRVYNEESRIEDWQSCCCSVCGHYDTRPYMYYFDEPNYCSYCGAKMEHDGE